MSVGPADRRTVVKTTLLGALGLGLGGSCRHQGGLVVPAPRRRFARVKVSPDRVIRTVAGLRPFRPSGFVVRAEPLGEKTVVHNYGHGGGGVTLSWGTADIAVEEARKTGATRFAVLGCGAVGLATARLLLQRGLDVTIYAKDLPPDTTSNVAGAQWSPFSVADPDRRSAAFDAQLVRAARFSHRYFQGLIGPEYGVRWIENYELHPQAPEPYWVQTLLPDLYPEKRALARSEHPFDSPYVGRYDTMLIETSVYLRALTQDVRSAGGRIVVREFARREELVALPEPVVVNCTGLGAKALFGDDELTPIKGQLSFLLPQPEVDYIVIGEGLYMFPRSDGILLGGTFERGNWTLEPDAAATQRILDGHRRLFAAMK
jgi:glycine/D-amino acid oxidase-like deaminating enzyme